MYNLSCILRLPAGVSSCRCMKGLERVARVCKRTNLGRIVHSVKIRELYVSLSGVFPLLCCSCFDYVTGLQEFQYRLVADLVPQWNRSDEEIIKILFLPGWGILIFASDSGLGS